MLLPLNRIALVTVGSPRPNSMRHGLTNGRFKVNFDPLPNSLSALISPPKSLAKR
jgi:hypothetical protein